MISLGWIDCASGQFAEVFDGGFAGQDAQQRFGPPPIDRRGVGPDGHLDEGGAHPFTGAAQATVPLVLAVLVAFETA
jgi:hypothetical protein